MDNIYCLQRDLIDINTRIAALERVTATYNRKYGDLPIMNTMLQEHFIKRDSILRNVVLARSFEKLTPITGVEADEVNKDALFEPQLMEEEGAYNKGYQTHFYKDGKYTHSETEYSSVEPKESYKNETTSKTKCNMGEDLGERELTDEERLRMRF